MLDDIIDDIIIEIITDTRDYLKCVYMNKFTLAGFFLVGISVGSAVYDMVSPIKKSLPENQALYETAHIIVASLGSACLGGTSFGRETLNIYRRVKDYLSNMETPEIDYYLRSKYHSGMYCLRKGIELAVKESGLDPSDLDSGTYLPW